MVHNGESSVSIFIEFFTIIDKYIHFEIEKFIKDFTFL